MTISEFFGEMYMHALPNTIKSSILYKINQDGGSIGLTFYYLEKGKNIHLECDIDAQDDKPMKAFVERSNKEMLQFSFLDLANQYGGVKSFLEFQPNFRTLHKVLFK